jgi:hypothetical protein
MRLIAKVQNEELYALYSTPDIIRVIKPKRLRWVGHLARMRAMRDAYKILVKKPERRKQFEDPKVDGRIILKWISEKWFGRLWTG